MRKKLRTLILPAAALVVGAGITGAVAVHAASDISSNSMSNLAQAIATKFSLNQTEVEQVIKEHHTQMHAQHQQAFKDRLQQAVTDGKLTQEQIGKITAKLQELESQRESLKASLESKTPSEVRAIMEQQKQQLQQWAADNAIPTEFLPFIGKFKMMHGHH